MRRDPQSELRFVSSFFRFQLQAENPKFKTEKKIYELLSQQQLWLIHVWPSSAETAVVVSPDLLQKWLV